MANYKYNETVGVKISSACKSQLKEIASEKEKSLSKVVRESIMDKIATTEDVELSKTMKIIVNNREEYRRVQEKLLLMELENERINASYKSKTFLGYVDKSLCSMMFELNEIYEQNELESHMVDHLESFMPRAEYHGVEDRIEDRMERPLHYARQKAEQLKKQNAQGRR